MKKNTSMNNFSTLIAEQASSHASNKNDSYTSPANKIAMFKNAGKIGSEPRKQATHKDDDRRNHQKEGFKILKARINALEDRLFEIKKNYELSKSKKHNKSIDGKQYVSNKQNDKMTARSNKKLKLTEKTEGSSHKKLATFQSPKNGPLILQQKNMNIELNTYKKSVKLQEQKEKEKEKAILSQYVTQYQESNLNLERASSQSNLFKPVPKHISQTQIGEKSYRNQTTYYISAILKSLSTKKQTTFDQLAFAHINASYEFMNFIKKNHFQKPPKPTIKKLPSICPSKQHTIIFDLDETLIHCHETKTADVTLAITFPDKKKINVGINIRPYARECLKELSKYFELMIFTASHSCYANAIINYLDPGNNLISYRFSRQHCYKAQQGFYVKDLRVIDRKLSKILLIDNAAYSYCFQPENGVPIVPFYDNKADLELKNLIPYLKQFQFESDVRIKNSQTMKTTEYVKFGSIQQLIDQLYR